MNTNSRIATGVILIILGLFLISISIFYSPSFVWIVYGLVILIVGIFIFFNKKEDKIEEIKENKNE